MCTPFHTKKLLLPYVMPALPRDEWKVDYVACCMLRCGVCQCLYVYFVWCMMIFSEERVDYWAEIGGTGSQRWTACSIICKTHTLTSLSTSPRLVRWTHAVGGVQFMRFCPIGSSYVFCNCPRVIIIAKGGR